MKYCPTKITWPVYLVTRLGKKRNRISQIEEDIGVAFQSTGNIISIIHKNIECLLSRAGRWGNGTRNE